MLNESIKRSLQSYDGKHVAPFRSIADELAIRPDALEVTISIVESNEIHASVGGTWILKYLLELGLEIDTSLCKTIIQWLRNFSENDARLHLLQILNIIDIPKSCHEQLYNLSREFTSDKNTLVRAWAYNALGIIAHQNPKYQVETLERFAHAMKAESPSFKARIRNTRLFSSKKN